MNSDGLKVMFRTRGQMIFAPLELERNRAFAILYQYGPKGTSEVIKSERLELDINFLEKTKNPALIGADYIYKKEIEMPDPEKN